MKRILTVLLLLSSVTTVFADNYNSISIQGQLTSTTPINTVSVHILSAGAVVGTASDINLVPDADGIFSTQTYITNPWVFRTGSDYTMRLSTPGGTISTFSITAVPFALTVRGDAQTGNQNIFGAYGNIGIGTGAPLYRLEISSAAGSSEDIVVISTGTSAVIRMSGAGVIRANKYYGDGSSLTGIVASGDNLGNHTATQNLNMAKYDITNASTATFTGYINVTSTAGYQQDGATILTSPGFSDLFVGYQAGYVDTYASANYNTMLGFLAGSRDINGIDNSFIGSQAGYSNVGGSKNSFVGYAAGWSNTSGSDNSMFGYLAGFNNTTGERNSFFGDTAGEFNINTNDNTYLGYWAGRGNIASNNTFVGSYAGSGISNGSNNSFLGYQTGYSDNSGSNNIYIGYRAGYSNTSVSNSIILGYNQTSSASSTLNIGGVLYGNLLNATISIGTNTQNAALDVLSTGTASNQYAQIWRNSNGVISSMSAIGVMMATKFIGDGSSLTGVTASGAVQKTGDTMTGQLTLAGSTLTVSGSAFSVGGSTLVVTAGRVGIGTTAPQGRLDILSAGSAETDMAQIWRDGSGVVKSSISATGVMMAAKFVGDGASLTTLNASNLASGTVADGRLSSNIDLLNSNQTITGVKTFTSTITYSAGIVPINVLTFTSGSGTYTPVAGTRKIKVTVIGGGGGGGGAAASSGNGGGGGGSGGGTCILYIANPSGAYAYVVGAGGIAGTTSVDGRTGGVSSFTATAYATGGGGGGTASAGTKGGGVNPPGSGVGCTINSYGASGNTGSNGVASIISGMAGSGGSSFMGGGGMGSSTNGGASGGTGYNYGGGGGGGTYNSYGGAGAGGIVIVEEYF